MPICDPFRQQLRQNLVQEFKDDFNVLSGNKWFLGISRPMEWVNAAGVTNDNVPPVNIDCIQSDIDFWRLAIALKNIRKEDTAIVIPRYDWASGETYTPYRHTNDLFDDSNPARFYVLVDLERVYKCIDNNYDSPSTVAPTHTDSQIRTLSDGYRWKYLYSIPESKRKFLTTGTASVLGFMPVEHLTSIGENDDREAQWDVQNAAVDGAIDFIELDETLRSYTISDKALFYSNSNPVISGTAAGSSTILIGGSQIVPQNNYYDNMILRIESGLGAGQQRAITNYTYNSNGTALVTLEHPLNYSVTGGTGSDASYFSILPNVKIVGNGSAQTDPLNTYADSAEVTVRFLNESATGSTGQKYIDSFELANPGQYYTYASVNIVAGLTFVAGVSADIGNLATPIISPKNGHGYNPVDELGAASIMISMELDRGEDGYIPTDNDYRQLALIKNPLLVQSYSRLYFSQAGLSASFTVGTTATQGMTGVDGATSYTIASGRVVEWTKGTLGTTGTSELVVKNPSADFEINGLVNGSFGIEKIQNCTIAGTEGRSLRKLRLIPQGASSFNGSGTDFTPGYWAIGLGNSGSSINPSFANGRIYSWEPEIATNTVGNLFIEYPQGTFNVGEFVGQHTPSFGGTANPIGKIIEIDEYSIPYQNLYNQLTKMQIAYDGIELLDDSSFALDDLITGYSGTTEYATGYVVEWNAGASGTTGALSVIPYTGNFVSNLSLLYTNSSATGGTITSIVATPEIEQVSGDIVHIQNIRPITRSIEQKEEIKFIIQY